MPREICQQRKLDESRVVSRCVDCSAQGNCHDAVALQIALIGKEPGVVRAQIIGACSQFQPYTGSFFRGERSLLPALEAAEVLDLCESCPSSTKDGCGHRKRLDTLISVARHEGRVIKPVVVACTTLKPEAPDKLWQISEPGER